MVSLWSAHVKISLLPIVARQDSFDTASSVRLYTNLSARTVIHRCSTKSDRPQQIHWIDQIVESNPCFGSRRSSRESPAWIWRSILTFESMQYPNSGGYNADHYTISEAFYQQKRGCRWLVGAWSCHGCRIITGAQALQGKLLSSCSTPNQQTNADHASWQTLQLLLKMWKRWSGKHGAKGPWRRR